MQFFVNCNGSLSKKTTRHSEFLVLHDKLPWIEPNKARNLARKDGTVWDYGLWMLWLGEQYKRKDKELGIDWSKETMYVVGLYGVLSQNSYFWVKIQDTQKRVNIDHN